mgnify:CR=1 FL=1|tara:strand:+ start:824 stop:1093 length:270 start_codon:yes stop_codon:yes gene_type:complete
MPIPGSVPEDRLTGVPAYSGLGYFVPGGGYTLPSGISVAGNFEMTLSKVSVFRCVISPKNPIAIIVKNNRHNVTFVPAVRESENTFPQT